MDRLNVVNCSHKTNAKISTLAVFFQLRNFDGSLTFGTLRSGFKENEETRVKVSF